MRFEGSQLLHNVSNLSGDGEAIAWNDGLLFAAGNLRNCHLVMQRCHCL
jgi:hypothetical protein